MVNRAGVAALQARRAVAAIVLRAAFLATAALPKAGQDGLVVSGETPPTE